jgi:hypothetical protein
MPFACFGSGSVLSLLEPNGFADDRGESRPLNSRVLPSTMTGTLVV